MSFGLTFDKLLIIAVIALLLLGPERIPGAMRRLGDLARRARDYIGGARDRMRDEMGPEFDDIDWKQLDPRQYDPRRIIREALMEPAAPASESAFVKRQRQLRAERGNASSPRPETTPFDPDAT